MRDKVFINKLSKAVVLVAVVIILLLPFHAFLTVFGSSLVGHYTILRLWKEYLLFFITLGAILIVIVDTKARNIIFKSRLTWAIIAYAALDLGLGAWSYATHHVSGKALAYGLLDDLRFLLFLMVTWTAAIHYQKTATNWSKLILWPAIIVVIFGLLQMSVLPKDFLAHFGYGPKTIMPYQTINNNPNYVRILSTLRGSDPLGAYLILPISALFVLIVSLKNKLDWKRILVLIGSLVVLYGSYSRGAWIGALIAVFIISLTLVSKDFLLKFKWPIIISGSALVIVLIVGGIVLSGSTRFQNIIFHTQTNSSVPIGSDQQHFTALRQGVDQLAKYPLGKGPGSSGPASVYNHDAAARIPEDYFLEVGEEAGWLGLALFIAINCLIGYQLWLRRNSPFALTLFAALIGITFVNLLTLSWTDDTLSYLWWGLAGLCLDQLFEPFWLQFKL